jgi:hypothetical protein
VEGNGRKEAQKWMSPQTDVKRYQKVAVFMVLLVSWSGEGWSALRSCDLLVLGEEKGHFGTTVRERHVAFSVVCGVHFKGWGVTCHGDANSVCG